MRGKARGVSVTALIVAAGSGSRVGGKELKQFRWVAGKPMLLHSVQAFHRRRDVAMVVCVLPREFDRVQSARAAERDERATPRVEAALDRYAAEFAALRREGFTRTLADEVAERIFALGFALDQLRLHLRDLARCVAELGPSDSAAVADATASSARA